MSRILVIHAHPYPRRSRAGRGLLAGRLALEVLGDARYEAREAADHFRAHNVATLEELLPPFTDEARRMSVSRAARD